MPIDNDIYDRLGGSWWDESSPLNLLHGSMTPGRFSYFLDVLTRRGKALASGSRVLDIGCGGGFLAEEFAALGCQVTGVDPSPVSIGAARTHAAAHGLHIDYRMGSGEHLPVPDSAFDLACCCDVLEHVSGLDRVISETARVLKPGGLYLFDTVNRTVQSKLIAIKAMQQWPLTRVTDAAIHDWDMFIKPGELADVLRRHGLEAGEMVGLGPRASLPAVLASFIAVRRGRITYGEFSRRLDIGRVNSTGVSYMGFATKAASGLLAGVVCVQSPSSGDGDSGSSSRMPVSTASRCTWGDRAVKRTEHSCCSA
jgi:2-polyprenyl-6-hydroxyphenyl methylase / 3-demethylubiquinone-9 3-methyltransferase